VSDRTSGATARAVPLRVPTDPRTAPAPESAPQRWLRLVPQRRSRAARAPFAVVLVGVLGGGLLGLLLLNTLVAQDSFRLHQLAQESRSLQQREEQLAGQLEANQAPSALAARAARLGLVPGGPPVFLRLPDGRVLGKPVAGKEVPAPAAKTERPGTPTAAASAPARPRTAPRPAARPQQPQGSTTWTAPRQTSPPSTAGESR